MSDEEILHLLRAALLLADAGNPCPGCNRRAWRAHADACSLLRAIEEIERRIRDTPPVVTVLPNGVMQVATRGPVAYLPCED